jgi:hypothetical protein
MRIIALSISALLMVAACSDDTQAPKPDQKLVPLDLALREAQPPKPDGVTGTDAKPASDGTTASDAAGGALSCGGATDDAQTCTKTCPSGTGLLPCLVKCNDDARKKACATGQVLFDKLVTCISTTCIADCIAGATPACETCTKTKCKTDYDTCYAHKC